jgi:hypothetical protein
VRFFGCVLFLLGFTSSAFATQEYKEIWNPPEARGASLKHPMTAHKPAKNARVVQRIAKTRTHRVLASTPELAMKQHSVATGAAAKTPDLSDIPRQITPEGNVLRVDSRNTAAQVMH